MNNLEFMMEAYKEAEKNSATGFKEGGPFGAIIVKGGEIIGRGKNSVLANCDPTAHAEIMAIRDACRHLGTHDLSGCVLYTSCYPCAMCLAAIIWSNIKTVYYGNTREDAANIGFRDDMIYEVICNIEENKDILELEQIGRDETIMTFEKFRDSGELY